MEEVTERKGRIVWLEKLNHKLNFSTLKGKFPPRDSHLTSDHVTTSLRRLPPVVGRCHRPMAKGVMGVSGPYTGGLVRECSG